MTIEERYQQAELFVKLNSEMLDKQKQVDRLVSEIGTIASKIVQCKDKLKDTVGANIRTRVIPILDMIVIVQYDEKNTSVTAHSMDNG